MFVTHLVHTAKNSTECPNRANSECKQPNKKKKKTHLVHVLQRKAALGQLNINTVYCQYFKVHN